MSTKLNGNRNSRPGSRVPYHLLETAIAWEGCRSQVLTSMGRFDDAMVATSLMRKYQQRVVDEAEEN